MNHWWVNHSQTFKSEFDGGYIWSPKSNANGAYNQTYKNLTLTNIGDLIFSYSDTKIKAIGLIKSNFESANKPAEFEENNKNWGNNGYLVRVNWIPINPLSPKQNINEIRNLLPSKYSPIQSSGNGNQGIYLASISSELSSKLIELILINNSTIKNTLEELVVEIEEDHEVDIIRLQNIPETQKEQLVKSRIGQGLFKNRVIEIENKCRFTGLTDTRFLVASHIKPWRDSNNEERLDGDNGLLLSPHIDKLFDKGWITFTDTGDIIIKNEIAQSVIDSWKISIANIGSFNEKQKIYLEHHREKVFNCKPMTRTN